MRHAWLFVLSTGCHVVTGLDEFAVDQTASVTGGGGAGGAGDGGGSGGTSSSACMVELGDGFDSLAIDTMTWEPWTQNGAVVEATGSNLRVQWSGGVEMHAGILSLAHLALGGCAVEIEVVRAPGAPGTQAFVYLGSVGNRAGIRVLNGELHFVVETEAAMENTPLAYLAAEHRYWRMREQASALHFETSSDAAQWTTRAVYATPPLLAVPQRLNIGAGLALPSLESGAADALFDNLRVGTLVPK